MTMPAFDHRLGRSTVRWDRATLRHNCPSYRGCRGHRVAIWGKTKNGDDPASGCCPCDVRSWCDPQSQRSTGLLRTFRSVHHARRTIILYLVPRPDDGSRPCVLGPGWISRGCLFPHVVYGGHEHARHRPAPVRTRLGSARSQRVPLDQGRLRRFCAPRVDNPRGSPPRLTKVGVAESLRVPRTAAARSDRRRAWCPFAGSNETLAITGGCSDEGGPVTVAWSPPDEAIPHQVPASRGCRRGEPGAAGGNRGSPRGEWSPESQVVGRPSCPIHRPRAPSPGGACQSRPAKDPAGDRDPCGTRYAAARVSVPRRHKAGERARMPL